MKKALCLAAFLVLAAELPLWCYDTSPATWQVVPEVIWSKATGGGTWVTEIQITSFATTTADVGVDFFYDGGTIELMLSPGLTQYHSVRFSNILATIDSLDSGPTVYFGKVGALWFWTLDSNARIQVQAKTVNGNFGKTFPGLGVVEANSAALGRKLIIQDLVQNATYRTFIGVFNTSATATYTVGFWIMDADGAKVGTNFNKTLAPFAFLSFNPFVEAGVPSGAYANCWLSIEVTSGVADVRGVMCFGSIANNYTNDTYALIARMGQ